MPEKGSSNEKKAPPINRGGRSAEGEERSLRDLIKLEWKIIDELWVLAKNAEYDKHCSLYYQSLASHARTLMLLLKSTGETGKEGEDLAKMLQRIAKKVKKFLRDEQAWRRP